jgi:UDP-N-acetylglucosamine 2-epimerase (non-hydrolysing)
MGALLGKVHRCDICHVEAGLRSFNYLRPFPEEICRVLVSRLTSYAFCPNDWAMNNIKTRKSRNFNTLENTLLDSMSVALSAGHGTNEPKLSGKYFLFVLHRQENLFNTDFVERIIAKIIEESQKIKCVFILHKPTETTLEKLRLLDRIKENKNIICLPRQSYITFTRLLHECQFIVTDGGSNQEESYYFGKPCLVLRSETERIEGLDRNVLMSKLQFNIINEFFLCPEKYCYPPVQLNSRPSQVIIDKLMEIPGASRLHPSLA